MRKPKTVALGPQYRGSKINRDEIDESDEDDPFSRGFDEEDSEEEGDEGSEDEADDGDSSEAASDDMGDGTSDTDMSDGESGPYHPRLARPVQQPQDKQALLQLQELEKQTQRAVTASISQGNKDDAEKGRAVKKQRLTFDSLLNTRMKLQKSLIATNTLAGLQVEQIDTEMDEAHEAHEAAEIAAFNLWSTLDALREDILASRREKKRKRSAFSMEASTDDLWAHAQAQESESRPYRDQVLRKWSNKAQAGTAANQSGRLNKKDHQPSTIIDSLQEQLLDTDRLLKRAQAPRSCAPLQVSQRIAWDDKIYDDADFYGILLKELLEQKSHDSVAASNIDVGFQMRRENKTRKHVDTKASKGRKLRYTVHEKLQNFMAPEDRTTWGERQADELFGSLFGQRLALAEREDEDAEDDFDAEEAGLLMFRG